MEYVKKVILFFIRCYQVSISPYLGKNCRFLPCCSEYAMLAISEKGIVKGLFLTIARLSRCHPWSCGGVDWPTKETRKAGCRI